MSLSLGKEVRLSENCATFAVFAVYCGLKEARPL